jgi:hypothetical protein
MQDKLRNKGFQQVLLQRPHSRPMMQRRRRLLLLLLRLLLLVVIRRLATK